MKKVNFKKLGKQFLAAVFSIFLLSGVMLNTQKVEAQTPTNKTERTKANFDGPLSGICKQPGTDCEAPVIIIKPSLSDAI
jgi:hypothetical protein